jgi:hypothetical protein
MRKLDLAIVLAAIAGGTLLIEQDHRVVIDAPAAAQAQSLAAAACPANDTLPYDSRCLDYLNVPTEPGPRLRVITAAWDRAAATAGCPDSDRVPYSPGCIAFLKGAGKTDMRWRVTE